MLQGAYAAKVALNKAASFVKDTSMRIRAMADTMQLRGSFKRTSAADSDASGEDALPRAKSSKHVSKFSCVLARACVCGGSRALDGVQ